MARTLNFDRHQTLIAAMELFWRQGYAQTSVADLVKHLGINRFSLYNTYGDKQALYHQALGCYLDTVSFPLINQLFDNNNSFDHLASLIKQFSMIGRQLNVGCFLQNAVLERGPIDEVVLSQANQFFELLTHKFNQLLNDAKIMGQIRADVDSAKVGRFLVMQLQGIVALSKAQQYQIVDDSIDVLLEYIESLR
jgi:AcrR family transcriptional regulator